MRIVIAVLCIVILGMAVVLYYAVAPGGGTDTGLSALLTSAPVQAVPVKAEPVELVELLAAYVTNEVGADAKYRGHRIRTSGSVETVAKDLLDRPYMTISAAIGRTQAHCLITHSAVSRVGTLRPSQWVTIEGTVDGFLGDVQMSDCVVVPEPPKPKLAADDGSVRARPTPEESAAPSAQNPPSDAWIPYSRTAMAITGWVRLLGDTSERLDELAFESGKSLQVVLKERRGNAVVLEVVPPSVLPMLPTQPTSDDLVRWLVLSMETGKLEFATFEQESMPMVAVVSGDICGDDCSGTYGYVRQR